VLNLVTWLSFLSFSATMTVSPRGRCVGGEVPLWSSPVLHGAGANWSRVSSPLVSINKTYPCGPDGNCKGVISREFTTSNFFGNLSGDPSDGRSRIFTANNYYRDAEHLGPGTTYWIGSQAEPGSTLSIDFASATATGVLVSFIVFIAVSCIFIRNTNLLTGAACCRTLEILRWHALCLPPTK
jgi:hypothetical protein